MNAACEQFDVAIVGLGTHDVAMYEFALRGRSGDVGTRAVPAWGLIEDGGSQEGTFFAWLRSSGGRSGSVAIVRPGQVRVCARAGARGWCRNT